MLQKNEAHLVAGRFRHIFQILAIARRQHDGRDSGSRRRENLFLDATNGQDEASQRYLAGHGGVAAHRAPGQQ